MKDKKEPKEEIIKIDVVGTLISFLLLLSVILIMFGGMSFYIGFHNADLGQNIRYINAKYDLDLVETSVGNFLESYEVRMSGVELYPLGLQQMKFANLSMSLGWFLFGVTFILLIKSKILLIKSK